MFKSTLNRGFQITFDNGYTISCQFGTGNYCSRRADSPSYHEFGQDIVASPDCEVAIWREDDGNFITGEISAAAGVDVGGDGMVAGYVKPEEVAKLIACISSL